MRSVRALSLLGGRITGWMSLRRDLEGDGPHQTLVSAVEHVRVLLLDCREQATIHEPRVRRQGVRPREVGRSRELMLPERAHPAGERADACRGAGRRARARRAAPRLPRRGVTGGRAALLLL